MILIEKVFRIKVTVFQGLFYVVLIYMSNLSNDISITKQLADDELNRSLYVGIM